MKLQRGMLKYKMLLLSLCCPWLMMGQRRQQDIPVAVRVEIVEKADHSNLILFSKERPLKIGDFKARPDAASPGVGATYSGIAMAIEGRMEKGVLVTTVRLTVYFDAAQSWMKREGKTERVLKHEQNHFDLTAIKACDLAQAIAGASYDYRNLKKKLHELHRLHTSQLRELQKDYDQETKHGTVAEQQAVWAARIAARLAAADCF
jgi:hypothetical protein